MTVRWPSTKRESLLFVAWIVQIIFSLVLPEFHSTGWAAEISLFMLGITPCLLVCVFLFDTPEGQK